MYELTRTENGRQYAVNIYDDSSTGNLTTVNRATRVKITANTFSEADGTGSCPGIGTEVFSVSKPGGNGSGIGSGNGKNLTFRLTALGQQGISPNYSAANEGPGGSNYRCSYSLEIVLLHGGEGWTTGETVTISPSFASTAASGGGQATMTVRIEDHESTQVKATVATNHDGLIRPAPTPFDADTAVTAEAILGGMTENLPSGITAKIIGTGVYYSSANPFTIEVLEDDIMRVFQKSVNDVSRLPAQCRHGYIVKVSNARISDEDDYYLRFEGENDLDGSGSWVECAKTGYN